MARTMSLTHASRSFEPRLGQRLPGLTPARSVDGFASTMSIKICPIVCLMSLMVERTMRPISDVILCGRPFQQVLHARVVGYEKVRAGVGRRKVSFCAKFLLNGSAHTGIQEGTVQTPVSRRFLCPRDPRIGMVPAEIGAAVVIVAGLRRSTSGGQSGHEDHVCRRRHRTDAPHSSKFNWFSKAAGSVSQGCRHRTTIESNDPPSAVIRSRMLNNPIWMTRHRSAPRQRQRRPHEAGALIAHMYP